MAGSPENLIYGVVDGGIRVVEFPFLRAFEEDGLSSSRFPLRHVCRLDFFDHTINFQEQDWNDEQLYYYLCQPSNEFGLATVELIIGTRETGDRLRLTGELTLSSQVSLYETRRYQNEWYWRPVRLDDPDIFIASRRDHSEKHTLQYNTTKYPKGYWSPREVMIELSPDGSLTLISQETIF